MEMHIQQQLVENCIEVVLDKNVMSPWRYTETEDSSFFIFSINL